MMKAPTEEYKNFICLYKIQFLFLEEHKSKVIFIIHSNKLKFIVTQPHTQQI